LALARIPLSGGAYPSASPLANQMACLNIYPERNPKDSPTEFTYYQRPGKILYADDGSNTLVRGLYTTSQDACFACIGRNIYRVMPGGILNNVGSITSDGTPVRFADNGKVLVIADGSPYGYYLNLPDGTLNPITDSTGTFTGANMFAYMDTFLLWNVPNSPTFGSTLSNTLTFDPLYTAAKTVYPDNIIGIIVNRHEILLLGFQTSEIWYNVGAAAFPFAILPGAYIEHGCAAPYSIAYQDIEVYWLSLDKQGIGMVMCQKGYNTSRISNHAIETQIMKMLDNGIGIGDAIGYTYQYRGHIFYVLSFPAGNQTWVYDATIGDPEMAWHQRGWTDPQSGILYRERDSCFTYFDGQYLVGDCEHGIIYALNHNVHHDYVRGGGQAPIKCVRTFPQILQGMDQEQQQAVIADGRQIKVNKFVADISGGTSFGGADLTLRWSTDRGYTFNAAPVTMGLGQLGEYSTQPRFAPLGVGRWWVLELSWQADANIQLNGGWVDAEVLAN
jgi:hypothetical protein